MALWEVHRHGRGGPILSPRQLLLDNGDEESAYERNAMCATCGNMFFALLDDPDPIDCMSCWAKANPEAPEYGYYHERNRRLGLAP